MKGIIKIFYCSVFLFGGLQATGQSFSYVDAGIVGVGRSSVAWADYDKDGDLDILVSGDTGTGIYIMSVYRNDAGEFTNINAGLTGIYNSSVAWGDYDNDGDPDILATGRSASYSKSFLYRNDNGVFAKVEIGLPDIGSNGCVAWCDYDGDGDLDIAIAGNYSSRILRNDGSVFTDIHALLPYVSNCWINWGDFDNDGDQDLFVMGDLGGILISNIYCNNNGNFTEVSSNGILPLCGGSASWCDYDHDMDLDLIICGFDEYLEPQTRLFRNDANLSFTDTYQALIRAALGTVAWADYDNDGDDDLLLTGQNAGCGTLSCIIYRNDNGSFTDINAPLEGAERGSAAWGDFDNDGDPDLLISGISGTGTPRTRLYSNNSGTNQFSIAQPPLIPFGLNAMVLDHDCMLVWDKASDNTTPVPGLTYNVRIGTTPGGNEVFPGNSDPFSNNRLVPAHGNVGSDTAWMVHLPDGAYYWSVQAIDHAFAASGFAPEQYFTVLNVNSTRSLIRETLLYPVPFRNILIIHTHETAGILIRDSAGRIVFSGNSAGLLSVNTALWPSGVYYMTAHTPSSFDVRSIVRH